jgi:hypothetical protein
MPVLSYSFFPSGFFFFFVVLGLELRALPLLGSTKAVPFKPLCQPSFIIELPNLE